MKGLRCVLSYPLATDNISVCDALCTGFAVFRAAPLVVVVLVAALITHSCSHSPFDLWIFFVLMHRQRSIGKSNQAKIAVAERQEWFLFEVPVPVGVFLVAVSLWFRALLGQVVVGQALVTLSLFVSVNLESTTPPKKMKNSQKINQNFQKNQKMKKNLRNIKNQRKRKRGLEGIPPRDDSKN